MGTSVGTQVFVKFGWRPAAALSVAWTGFSLVVLLVRGPNCSRFTWFGYEGGLRLKKLPPQSNDTEKGEKVELGDGSEKNRYEEKGSLQEKADDVQDDVKVARSEEIVRPDDRSEDSATTKRNP